MRTRRPLRWYRGAGRGVRAHVAVRWRTCPFGPLLEALPETGRILDWGSGHGLLAVAAVEAAPGRTVHGVDIDAVKVAAASAVVAASPYAGRTSFALVAPEARPAPGDAWEAVVLNDVLYLLDGPSQQALVLAAAGAVVPGGRVVVKDMAVTPRWKAAASRLQEQVTVRLLGLTASGSGVHRSPAVDDLVGWLEGAGLAVAVERVDRGYHCPHVLVVGRRPEAHGGGPDRVPETGAPRSTLSP